MSYLFEDAVEAPKVSPREDDSMASKVPNINTSSTGGNFFDSTKKAILGAISKESFCGYNGANSIMDDYYNEFDIIHIKRG